MTLKAVIHSKMLQVYASQAEAIMLANEGTARIPVFFQDGSKVGECTLELSPLTRLSVLVHLGKPIPDSLREAADQEAQAYRPGG